jgi:hypothetical protein
MLNKIYLKSGRYTCKVNDRNFSHFYEFPINQDLVLDSNPLKEYGNKAPRLKS